MSRRCILVGASGKTGAGGGIHPLHTAPWQKGRYATPIRLLPLALEICLSDRICWRNVPLPFWRDKLGIYQVLQKVRPSLQQHGLGNVRSI